MVGDHGLFDPGLFDHGLFGLVSSLGSSLFGIQSLSVSASGESLVLGTDGCLSQRSPY